MTESQPTAVSETAASEPDLGEASAQIRTVVPPRLDLTLDNMELAVVHNGCLK